MERTSTKRTFYEENSSLKKKPGEENIPQRNPLLKKSNSDTVPSKHNMPADARFSTP
jgi:hypothetical protein